MDPHWGNRMNAVAEITQVTPSYRHYDKTVHSLGSDLLKNSRLKWYEIARGKQPVAGAIRDLALDFVTEQAASAGIPSAQELGFVFLHRCGQDFYFLGVCTWRNNNELWKTIYYYDAGKMEGFALHPQDKAHKDTFCVWELAVVSHETLAWQTYLRSDRTADDQEVYLKAVIK